MSLSKKYFLNKYHIKDMDKLNEELKDIIRYLENTIILRERAMEVSEQFKTYMESNKAVRSAMQLLYDLDFISYNYIKIMENLNKNLPYSDMMNLNYEIKSILSHFEDTIEFKRTIEDQEEAVQLLINLNFTLSDILLTDEGNINLS